MMALRVALYYLLLAGFVFLIAMATQGCSPDVVKLLSSVRCRVRLTEPAREGDLEVDADIVQCWKKPTGGRVVLRADQ